MAKCDRCNGTGQIYDPISTYYGFAICGKCLGSGRVKYLFQAPANTKWKEPKIKKEEVNNNANGRINK